MKAIVLFLIVFFINAKVDNFFLEEKKIKDYLEINFFEFKDYFNSKYKENIYKALFIESSKDLNIYYYHKNKKEVDYLFYVKNDQNVFTKIKYFFKDIFLSREKNKGINEEFLFRLFSLIKILGDSELLYFCFNILYKKDWGLHLLERF